MVTYSPSSCSKEQSSFSWRNLYYHLPKLHLVWPHIFKFRLWWGTLGLSVPLVLLLKVQFKICQLSSSRDRRSPAYAGAPGAHVVLAPTRGNQKHCFWGCRCGSHLSVPPAKEPLVLLACSSLNVCNKEAKKACWYIATPGWKNGILVSLARRKCSVWIQASNTLLKKEEEMKDVLDMIDVLHSHCFLMWQ